MKVDLVIATYNRARQVQETLENVLSVAKGINKVYIVNNNSEDDTLEKLEKYKSDNVVIINNERNLGAAGGKNVGLRRSDSDIIIVMDDDAIFSSSDPVARVKEIFLKRKNLGVIQFKIENYQEKKILKHEFPGDDPDERGDESFEIGYFIGAGHAIRKSVLDEVGYYPDDFGLYGHEEIDLSYRVVNGGYRMRYEPSISVYHKKDPSGRISRKEVFYNMYYYRLIMNYKYLPFPYRYLNNLLWSIKTVIDSRSLPLAIRAYKDYVENRMSIKKEILNREAIRYLKENNGRLYR